MNWYVWATLWLVAWLWQNMMHELSHLWNGWRWEGRHPRKFIPWAHWHLGYWYWSRYECGPPMKNGSARHRHTAPIRWASVQIFVVSSVMSGFLLAAWRWEWPQGSTLAFYFVPFLACPIVDGCVWLWGMLARRPGTDGDRWRQIYEQSKESKLLRLRNGGERVD